MAAKKDNQIKPVEETNGVTSTITYANEVIATIVGMAVSDVEGVVDTVTAPGAKGGKNKNITRGIKVEVGPEEVGCEIYVQIEYGRPIQKVAIEVQENVRRSLETMTGLHVVRVDVHVQGVSFEKENNALTAGAQNARLKDAENAGARRIEEKTSEEEA